MLLATVLMVFMASVNWTNAHVLLETEHYFAENCIFDDRQYEQHARRRREISFSSVEFERLIFGSEENELGACVMLIWWGPLKKHRFSTKHDLRRALTAAPAVIST